ncbi:hypothetical protein [Kitasatospora sp. NPDC088134]|uniref:hypothetical protein n=1 Tax=Kitasatospora sp. NPDC088134 TaxID=3364071 RepID=UPI0038077B62
MRPVIPSGRRAALLFGTDLLLTPLAAGCSTSGDDGPLGRPVEAKGAVDSLLDGTIGAITPAVERRDGSYEAKELQDRFGRGNGKADLSKRVHLEERIIPAKAGVLLGQVETYWKGQGYAVGEEQTNARSRSVTAHRPDNAWVSVEVDSGGTAEIEAGVDGTKYPGELYPFKDPGAPEPLPNKTPAGRQDAPYWSH